MMRFQARLLVARFRSEFFGRLRDILKDRSDIRIVGDRFVFQSEVLFDIGSAKIGPEGERQLLELSTALRELSDEIPTDIDWVLQVSAIPMTCRSILPFIRITGICLRPEPFLLSAISSLLA